MMSGSVRTGLMVKIGCAVVIVCGAVGGVGGCASRGNIGDSTPPDRSEEVRRIDEAAAMVREAQRYEVAEKPDIALEKYRKAIETYRELPVAWNNMGTLLMARGEHMAAAEAFQTASELTPTDPRPMHNLGTIWEKLGYLDDAAKWYDKALERDETYLPSLRRRVLIDQLLDRVDDRSFERCRKALLLEKDPWWIDRLKRANMKMQESARSSEAGTGTGTGSAATAYPPIPPSETP